LIDVFGAKRHEGRGQFWLSLHRASSTEESQELVGILAPVQIGHIINLLDR